MQHRPPAGQLAHRRASDRLPGFKLGEAKLALRAHGILAPAPLGPKRYVGTSQPMVDLARRDPNRREAEAHVVEPVLCCPQERRVPWAESPPARAGPPRAGALQARSRPSGPFSTAAAGAPAPRRPSVRPSGTTSRSLVCLLALTTCTSPQGPVCLISTPRSLQQLLLGNRSPPLAAIQTSVHRRCRPRSRTIHGVGVGSAAAGAGHPRISSRFGSESGSGSQSGEKSVRTDGNGVARPPWKRRGPPGRAMRPSELGRARRDSDR